MSSIIHKDIALLSQKATMAGTEKIPVSDTEYVTTSQIAGFYGKIVYCATESDYESIQTKDAGTLYVIPVSSS